MDSSLIINYHITHYCFTLLMTTTTNLVPSVSFRFSLDWRNHHIQQQSANGIGGRWRSAKRFCGYQLAGLVVLHLLLYAMMRYVWELDVYMVESRPSWY